MHQRALVMIGWPGTEGKGNVIEVIDYAGVRHSR